MYRCASGSDKNSGLVVGMGTDLQDFQAGDADELVFFPGSKNSGTNEDYKCGGDRRGEGGGERELNKILFKNQCMF
jgi:hypothetical protein